MSTSLVGRWTRSLQAHVRLMLSIDVEGAELDVLRGGVTLFTGHRPSLVVEFSTDELVQEARLLLPDYAFKRIGGNHWLLRGISGAHQTNARGRALSGALAGSMLTGVLGQAVLVVSGVLVARMLGPENRGHLALIVFLPVVLAQVVHLGLPQAMTYYVARIRESARGVAHGILPPAVSQAAVAGGLHLLLLPVFFAGSSGTVWAAAAMRAVVAPAGLAQQYGLALLQGQRRFRAFNVLRVLPPSMYSASVLVLLLVGGDFLPLAAVAWVIPQVVGATITGSVAIRGLSGARGQLGPPRREMVRFGLKGFLGSASPVETFRLDQAVIGLFLSPVALGLYVVGLAFTSLPRFIAQSIGMVAYPRIAAEADAAAARRAMWRFLWLTMGFCALVIGPIWAGAGFLVPFFFGGDFSGSVTVTRILLVGSMFLAARRILSDATRGLGLPYIGSIAEVVSWLALYRRSRFWYLSGEWRVLRWRSQRPRR